MNIKNWEEKWEEVTDTDYRLGKDNLFKDFEYPESEYELCPDKVRDLIKKLIKEEREKTV